MSISKEWLKSKIIEIESTRDEIPFGLDDEDSDTLAVLKQALADREELERLQQRVEFLESRLRGTEESLIAAVDTAQQLESELERLRAQEPIAWTDEQELRDLEKHKCAYLFTVDRENPYHDPRRQITLYAEPKPLAVPDVEPSLQAMMQALDAFYSEEDVPENGMSAAYRILLNDCRSAMLQSSSVVKPSTEDSNSFTDAELEMMSHGNNPQSNAYRELLEYRRNSPAVPDGWIPCSERMPVKGERVLAFIDFDSTAVTPLRKDAEYTGSTFRVGPNTINTTGEPPRVTHWMPLPAAPEMGDG